MSSIGPYTAIDASAANKGVPVWNVKGPDVDRLITGPSHVMTMQMAREVADDLNIAWLAGYRDGFENGKGSPK